MWCTATSLTTSLVRARRSEALRQSRTRLKFASAQPVEWTIRRCSARCCTTRNVATDGMTPERGRYVGRSPLVLFGQTLVQMITMLMLPAAAVALIRVSGVAASAQDDVDIPASLAAGIQHSFSCIASTTASQSTSSFMRPTFLGARRSPRRAWTHRS